MSHRDAIAAVMPALLAHEGVWTGTYRTVDLDGRVIDEHESRVECVFPDSGEFHYLQKNRFRRADGRETHAEFGGVLDGDRIVWDTATFSGYGWVTRDEVVLLTLERKDLARASFTEIIVLGSDRSDRARTWHWFQDGRLLKRTLCDEVRVG